MFYLFIEGHLPCIVPKYSPAPASSLLLLLLSGIVLGGFIGSLASSVPFLSWLNFGQSFGLNDPLVLDLGVLIITFGLSIKITLASLIGVVLALIVYRFI